MYNLGCDICFALPKRFIFVEISSPPKWGFLFISWRTCPKHSFFLRHTAAISLENCFSRLIEYAKMLFLLLTVTT